MPPSATRTTTTNTMITHATALTSNLRSTWILYPRPARLDRAASAITPTVRDDPNRAQPARFGALVLFPWVGVRLRGRVARPPAALWGREFGRWERARPPGREDRTPAVCDTPGFSARFEGVGARTCPGIEAQLGNVPTEEGCESAATRPLEPTAEPPADRHATRISSATAVFDVFTASHAT